MPRSQLSNYLHANRKRLGFSQRDVAFLLGVQSGAKISHYENFSRKPSLDTALALEVICKRSVSELFGGLYQKAEKEVARRAQSLLDREVPKLGSQPRGRRAALSELARM